MWGPDTIPVSTTSHSCFAMRPGFHLEAIAISLSDSGQWTERGRRRTAWRLSRMVDVKDFLGTHGFSQVVGVSGAAMNTSSSLFWWTFRWTFYQLFSQLNSKPTLKPHHLLRRFETHRDLNDVFKTLVLTHFHWSLRRAEYSITSGPGGHPVIHKIKCIDNHSSNHDNFLHFNIPGIIVEYYDSFFICVLFSLAKY